VEDWRYEHLLIIVDGCKPENIYNADEIGVFLRIAPNKMLNLKGSLHWWKDLYKDRTLLLGCSANCTGKIPHFITGSSENLLLQKCQKLPTHSM
jgi:hypothetical protein